jgi:5-methylcytosine-specific restriction endonuclease McrA
MWTLASAAARKRDGNKCVRCGSTFPLEVNHIVPRKGMGYSNGCHHHLNGLETLCRPHHVVETTRQLREWKYTDPPRPKGGTRRDRPSEAPSLPLWEFAT